MTREIKFRIWKPVAKSLMELEDEFVSEALCRSKNEKHILMQYTNLKDKNGKEIWEGDIITNEQNNLVNWPLVVNWHSSYGAFVLEKSTASFVPFYDIGNVGNVEVIGNIYENPLLLNQKT